MSIKRIIYYSVPSNTTSFETVIEILTESVRRNKEKHISGMLMYDGSYYLQCIEGESEAVDALMKKIMADPRHDKLTPISETVDTERIFLMWGMGYINHEKEIRKTIFAHTGSEVFDPSRLTKEMAESLLVDLSFLL